MQREEREYSWAARGVWIATEVFVCDEWYGR